MRWRAIAVLSAGAVLLIAAVTPPVRASEPIPGRPLPDEGTIQRLGDQVTATLPFDLDGDGARELITASGADEQPGVVAIEAWWIGDDGRAERSNQVSLRRTDQAGTMTAVRIDEPARLFTAVRAGQEVPLVAANGTGPGLRIQCCVTIWEVRAEGGTEISLDLVATTRAYGAQLVAADLDGDGTDELVVTESTDDPPGNLLVGILRWDGTGYVRTRTEVSTPLSCCFLIHDAGETDGAAGDDVLLFGLGDDRPGLIRLTLRNGFLLGETAQADLVQPVRILPLSTGPALLAGSEFGEIGQWTWPRDQPIEFVEARSVFESPLAVLGTGADTWIVTGFWPDPSSVTVMTGSPGAPTARVGLDIRAAAFVSIAPGFGGFTGVIPGGLPGIGDAFSFRGLLIRPAADPEQVVEVDSIATLLGSELAGAVGSRGTHMAVLTGQRTQGFGFGDSAPNPMVTDLLIADAPRSLDLVETTSVLEPERDSGSLAPTFLGAERDPERSLNLRVAHEAMSAEIIGPPGTRIWWSNEAVQRETVLAADGVAQLPLVDPPAQGVRDGPFDRVSIWLVTPAGHAYRGTWLVSVYRQSPGLILDEDVPFIDVAPAISGQTLPGATVTVNGRPGKADSDGFFSAPVDVGVVPTELRVVVTDPLGNQTERVVTRVWPLDYRQLPWIPLTVALTVAAGAVLFLRSPGTGRGAPRGPHEDSSFEDLGG